MEDEEPIVELLTETLSDGGFEVMIATSGEQAAELIATADDLQAVITDIRFGSGPDGWEIARLARYRCPDLPVIYMSGDSAHDWTEKGVPKSIMIQKPFAPAQVVTGVATLLNKTDEIGDVGGTI